MDLPMEVNVREMSCPVCGCKIRCSEQYQPTDMRIGITTYMRHLGVVRSECAVFMKQLATEQHEINSRMMESFSREFYTAYNETHSHHQSKEQIPMTDTTETSKDAVAVAKTIGKVVTKELAYQAGVHVAAVTILIGLGLAANKVQARRAKKAAASLEVVQ